MQRAIAVGAAWSAFMTGMLILGEIEDLGSFLIAGGSGAVLVSAGFAAAWRCRPLSPDHTRYPPRLMLLSLAAGTVLGLANLGANWAIAEADPRLRELLARRMAALRPLDGLAAAPLIEETAVRLFLMSVIAWVVSRFTKRSGLVFAIALVGSALVFALLHLSRPFPADQALASFYRAALVTKYTLAGLPLGWIFWRWGLPYAMLCHAAANAAHFALMRTVF
jgi:Type II CAAX prenyl endopeptidase Rce1-like